MVIASGHNERVQNADPIAHGEMSALRAAGRQKNYRDTTLYATLARAMCAGTIIQFKIARVVVGGGAHVRRRIWAFTVTRGVSWRLSAM
jgi:cytosine deaminase